MQQSKEPAKRLSGDYGSHGASVGRGAPVGAGYWGARPRGTHPGEGLSFPSCFSLHGRTLQGSKKATNVIQTRGSLVHPRVHCVTILCPFAFESSRRFMAPSTSVKRSGLCALTTCRKGREGSMVLQASSGQLRATWDPAQCRVSHVSAALASQRSPRTEVRGADEFWGQSTGVGTCQATGLG